ncbi:hypothetical protein BGZ79_000360, partial [Entomortierella chlamydospora]
VRHLSKRWHAEPPPVLQKPCLVVDKDNGRTYMIGYDSQNTLVFNFIDSTEACDNKKKELSKGEEADGGEWQENGHDWRHAQWTSLPYPGGARQGRRFDTEHCFLTSDLKFMVPSYEPDGEVGFSVWDHDLRTWTHIRNDKECSCHEEEVEHGGKVKVKKDKKKLKFEYPNLFTVVYQSYRAKGARHGGASPPGVEEAIDTVIVQWKDKHDRNHLTGIQLLNHRNHQGVGVWSIDTSSSNNHYEVTAQSQGGPSPGGLTCASCGNGIIVYGGCDRVEDCSTNLRPGEQGKVEGNAPVSIYRPRVRNEDDDSHESNTSSEGNTESGSSSSGGSGSGGSGSGSGSGGSGSGGSGGSGSGGSGSGGSGSGGSGSGGSGGSGSSGSGSGGSGSSGSGSGGSGSGSSDSGGSGSEASGQVIVGTSQTVGPSATPTNTAAITSNLAPLPSGAVPVPEGTKTNGGGRKNTGIVVGVILGLIALIALVSLLFLAARKRRRHDAVLAEAATSGSDGLGGASGPGPDGFIVGGVEEPKYPGGNDMPDLVSVAPATGGSSGPSSTEDTGIGGVSPVGTPAHTTSNTVAGPATAAGAAALATGVILATSAQQEHHMASHVTHEESSTGNPSNSMSNAKRGSRAKFFMGGGDYKPPLRKPSATPVAPILPITAKDAKSEVGEGPLESVEVVPRDDHIAEEQCNGAIAAGTAGVALAVGAALAAGAHQSKETRIDESSKTTTTNTTKTTNIVNGASSTSTAVVTSSKSGSGVTPDGTKEILSNSEAMEDSLQTHNRFESTNSTNMNVSGSSSVMYQGGTTSSSATSVSHTFGGSQTIISSGKTTTTTGEHIAEGMGMVAGATVVGAAVLGSASHQSKEQVTVQRQELPPTVQKTQITLKLSIIRYERSDAAQATPTAKPGTLMFSQVEMLEGAPDIHIPGSAFSHVRDSSKVTGHEDGLPSPVVPGPSGAASSTESEPRERSLRWMNNEFQWKREAGMLQHLRSDQHIVELFTLYSLPSFSEYRFVSVMGPFTRTLESYIKEREGIHSSSRTPTPDEQLLASNGPMTLAEIKSLTDSIASAIKWCHEHHVVHLSLTPASIFLQEHYSEPDGQGGYRASVCSSYSNKTPGARDSAMPRIEQRWKLWNFSFARFIGEAVDLSMDINSYTSPEILIASHRYKERSFKSITASETVNPNKDTSIVTTVSPEGVVTKTVTTKSSSSGTTVTANRDLEKLMAAPTMDMWSLGQIVYEMHTRQPMFSSNEDALRKLTSAEVDESDMDKAKTHDKIRQQLQGQIEKIEMIQDPGAREVIKGLLEVQQERRLDHEEIRNLYLDV